MATFGTLFCNREIFMKIAVSESRTARWLVFPNALDIVVMGVWVFVSHMIVVRIAIACGIAIPDFEAVESPDLEVALSAGDDMARTMLLIYGPSMLLAIAGALLYRRLRGGRGRAVGFSLAGLNPTLLLWGVVWMIATEIVAEPLFELLPPAPDVAGRGVWAVIMTIIVAPVLEEILCRGIILESLRSKYGVIAAWIFSSLFFGVIHGQITSMVNALIIGSILGYICIRSRSVLSSIFLHGVNNALALTAIYFGLGDRTFSSLIPDIRIYAVVYAVAAVLCTAGLIYLVLGLVKEARSEKAAKTEAQA